MPIFIIGAAVTGAAAWLVGDATEKTSNSLVKSALIFGGLYIGFKILKEG